MKTTKSGNDTFTFDIATLPQNFPSNPKTTWLPEERSKTATSPPPAAMRSRPATLSGLSTRASMPSCAPLNSAALKEVFTFHPISVRSGSTSSLPGQVDTADSVDATLKLFRARKAPLGCSAKPLILSPAERNRLTSTFDAALVDSRMAHDVFHSPDALHRQLAHEQKQEMSAQQFYKMDPAHLPPGWAADDTLINRGGGLTGLQTILRSSTGQCGTIVRSCDGHTLHLDEAYKSSLPSRLTDVPGFAQPVPTMNYLTARACRLLGVDGTKLGAIKINRLQHRPTLAHLEWLQNKYPASSLSQLIGHTTWARKYVRQAAVNVGLELEPEPTIALQGSAQWVASHPGAPIRDWGYTRSEAQRLTIKHLTGQEIAEVDDATTDWKTDAENAIACFKNTRCSHMNEDDAHAEAQRIDSMIAESLQRLHQGETTLSQRYGFSENYAPRHINFDVTFQTRKPDADRSAS